MSIKAVRRSANLTDTIQLNYLSAASFLAQYSYKYLIFMVWERS